VLKSALRRCGGALWPPKQLLPATRAHRWHCGVHKHSISVLDFVCSKIRSQKPAPRQVGYYLTNRERFLPVNEAENAGGFGIATQGGACRQPSMPYGLGRLLLLHERVTRLAEHPLTGVCSEA
jgi:hypothetical protein